MYMIAGTVKTEGLYSVKMHKNRCKNLLCSFTTFCEKNIVILLQECYTVSVRYC